MGGQCYIINIHNYKPMSKTKQKLFENPLELKPQHLDAIRLIDKFVLICRNIHQTPKEFEKSMNKLYKDVKNSGF